jgi:putative spermidine/putrescine transport system permease protein
VGGARRPPRFHFGRWLGVLPFFAFTGMFLIAPVLRMVSRSFQDDSGNFTLDNYRALVDDQILRAYSGSIRLSIVTALIGVVVGFFIAWALSLGGLPRWLRTPVITFAAMASNFAGVPLAVAFMFTVGGNGILTTWLEMAGFDLYETGFALYKFVGLALVYAFFQIPLMVLVLIPAFDGLKKDWREAAENLGATSRQYWRYVAFPILLPSLLGTFLLLFGNAFGAYATAQVLTGGSGSALATLLIGQQISGDVLNNQGLGMAVAVGMLVIMSIAILFYSRLQRRSERWLG